jgi:hypothetical protein
MNIATVTTRSRRARSTFVGGIALVALFSLAGCASNEGAQPAATATSTPTPTVAAPAAPESEDAAVDQATAALLSYYDMVNLIFDEGGVNPERIDAYATGVVLDQVVLDARQVAELGYQFEGGITAEVESGYAVEQQVGGETLEFGSVHLIFCNDSRDRSVVQADGSVPPLPADRAPRFDAGMSFDPVKASWFLTSLTAVGTSCA